MSLLRSLSTRQRLLFGGGVAGVLLVAFLLFHLASQPSYSLLQAGVDPAQTGRMTAALDQQGVAYRLANNGTAIEVQSAQLAQARVALAGQGLLGSGSAQPGSDLLGKQKLGASDFQQQVAYQHDLESQIAQTINQIAGVSGASVQLTMPKDQLFTDQQQPATAAVLLGGGPASLDPGAVRGVANLVASSVPNLRAQNVTITDGTGQLLWPSGDQSGGGGGAPSKPQAEARYDAMLAAQLNAIVARTVGPGKAQVQVQSDLNVDNTAFDKLAYVKKGVPMRATSDNETLRGTGGGAGGAAGAAANVPTYAGAGAGAAGGRSNYSHKTKATDFALGKVVTHTRVAPGAVNRLAVSLVVDPSVPAAVRAQLQQAVATAAGIQRGRDTVSTSVVPFAQAPPPASTLPISGMVGYAKYAALGLGTLLFLFFMARHLRRREDADLVGEPVWLRQVESPRPLAELAAPREQPTEILPVVDNARRQAVEEAVARDPERVAHTLRTWMDDE